MRQYTNILILVRHGESTKNLINMLTSDTDKYPLTMLGKNQAKAAAIELAKLDHVDKLYTSPTLRARETADIISSYIKVKPVINQLLMERDSGKQENMCFDSKEDEERNKKEQIDMNYPDYESWQSLIDRIRRFVESLPAVGTKIAVTHMDPIKPLLGYLLHKDEYQMWNVKIPPGSLTAIDLEQSGEQSVLAIGSATLPKQLIGL